MKAIIDKNAYVDAETETPLASKNPQNIADDSLAAVSAYANTWLDPKTQEGQQQAFGLKGIMDQMSFVHQRAHRPDPVNGDFECKECGTQGARSTVPAFPYQKDPWHLIIPVRNEEDAAVVAALLRKEEPPKPIQHLKNKPKNNHGRPPRSRANNEDRGRGHRSRGQNGGRGRGHRNRGNHEGRGQHPNNQGQRGGRGRRDRNRVHEGRIRRQRDEEKTTVLSRLAEEQLMEGLEDMDLLG
jgi:hypothetical protein